MRTVYRRGLPALLTVALTTGVVSFGAPAFAAGEAPTGTYTLNVNAIWPGQQVKLTETDLNDPEDGNKVTRTINWGDGSTPVVASDDQTSWTHNYSTTSSTTDKTYTVSVTLNDGPTEGSGTLVSPSVAVKPAPGNLGWQDNTIWTYPGYLNEAVFAPTNLPAAQAWTDWRDGEYTLLNKRATAPTAPHWFPAGVHTPAVQFENANGKATPRPAGPLSVQDDNIKPNSAFTWPAVGTRNTASSYRTLRGTGSDGQSGADAAEVVVFKYNANMVAYYDFAKKNWIKDSGADLPDSAYGFSTVSAGKWAVPVAGFAKGWQIEAHYLVYDKVGNYSNWKYASFYLSS